MVSYKDNNVFLLNKKRFRMQGISPASKYQVPNFINNSIERKFCCLS